MHIQSRRVLTGIVPGAKRLLVRLDRVQEVVRLALEDISYWDCELLRGGRSIAFRFAEHAYAVTWSVNMQAAEFSVNAHGVFFTSRCGGECFDHEAKRADSASMSTLPVASAAWII